MTATDDEIRKIAAKPEKTRADVERMRVLINISRQEQNDINNAEIAKSKAESADLRNRAAAAGISVREQFIQDNAQRFLQIANSLGANHTALDFAVKSSQQAAAADTNNAANSVSGVATSAVTESKSQVAKASRGRLVLKQAIKDKEVELTDATNALNSFRTEFENQDRLINEELSNIAKIAEEIGQLQVTDPIPQLIQDFIARSPSSVQTRIKPSDIESIRQSFLTQRRNWINDFQKQIEANRQRRAELQPKIAEQQEIVDTIQKELDALKSELEDLEKHIKDLIGVTDVKVPALTDIVADETKQDAEGATEQGNKTTDQTINIVFRDAEGNIITGVDQGIIPVRRGAIAGTGQTLSEVYADAEKEAVGGFGNAIGRGILGIQALITQAMRPVEELMEQVGRVTPETALSRAFTIAGAGMLVNFGIYTLATATDLLHPLKGTGIVPVAIDIARGIGPDLLSRTTVQAFADTALALPIRYRIGELARGFRPSGALADQLYFEGNISLETWRQLYRWQGWPEEFIDAQYKTMFIEPSDRLLVGMFEVAGVPDEWIRLKLKERGYNREDIEVISKYGKEKVIERARQNKENLIITRVKEGFITQAQASDELLALGFTTTQARRIIVAALLARDTEMRKDRVAAATSAFVKDAMDRNIFLSILADEIADPSMRRRILENAEFRRLPKGKGL